MSKISKLQEFKYPIMYAPLEIKEQGGYINNYEIITLGYAVSKCYLIESSIRYLINGSTELYHKVVFPYKNISALHSEKKALGKPNLPSYNAEYDIVSDVFDNYDDVKRCVEDKNNLLKLGLAAYKPTLLSDDDQEKYNRQMELYNAEVEELKKQLDVCERYEKLVLMETQKMTISTNGSEKVLKRLKK